MRLREIPPNPTGGIDKLFLLDGSGVDLPVTEIEGAGLLGECSGQGRLKIFHFNDLHNHLHDLLGETKGTPRFSQMVKRVRQARQALPDPILFLSIGDDHTGTMLDELIGWQKKDFVLDASYRAYSAGGVDVSVLGNHEFDRGSELLAMGIRQDANFPILSANVHSSAHLIAGQDYSPAAIAVCGGVRVGLLGLTTHVETRVGQENDITLAVASPSKVVGNILPVLAPLVDVVLILSHCGFGDGAHKSGKAAALRDIGEADFSIAQVASKCTDRPVLILGAHTHTRLNEHSLDDKNIYNGIPIFQAESNGKYLGEIEIIINSELDVGYAIKKACLHPIASMCEGNEAALENCEEGFEAEIIAPIVARVQGVLKSKITEIETMSLSGKETILSRYSDECPLANLICDAICSRLTDQGEEVDLAFINGATLQSGIEPGTLTAGEWFNVMPYADEVFVVSVSGNELVKILNSNAKRILRKEEMNATIHTGFLARGFFHSSSDLRYQIETGSSATEARATHIVFKGHAIETLLNHEFKIVMSTYLALGGFGERWNGKTISGGVPGNIAGYDLRPLQSRNTRLVFRDEVAHYLRGKGKITDFENTYCDERLRINN